MKINLCGWKTEGFRCPDIEVDLRRDGEVPKIGLIQMPNGTGKTTTLELLRAALTGNARDWDAEQIQALAKKGAPVEKGKMRVDLSVDNQGLTIELILDYVKNDVQYRTSYKEAGGVIQEWSPPNAVTKFLTDQFIKLFIFDGELAPKLIESEEHEAEKALDALFQLHLFDQIEVVAEQKWERQTQSKTGKTEMAKTRRENKLETIRERKRKVKEAKEETENRIDKLEEEIHTLDERMNERIDRVEELRKKREDADRRKKSANKKIDENVDELMGKIRSPENIHSSFSEAIEDLKGSLDKLKLPSHTSRQFFVELAQEDKCICGSKLDDDSRETILERAEEFLGSATSGFVNTLKHDIDKFINERSNPPSEETEEVKQDLVEKIDERVAAQGELRAIRTDLANRGDDKIEELEDEKKKKKNEKSKLDELLSEINKSPEPGDKDDPEETYCLRALEEMEEEAKKELSEITNTLELREQIDVLTKILQESQRRARSRLKDVIVEECRKRLDEILSFNPVEISEISGSLKLKNQKGASVGQTLAVAYTFLTTLLGRGRHQFPLVVDSPANPIDNTVRSEIADVIPELTDQFIAFTISSERSGFTNYLHRASDGDVKYLTLFRKNENTQSIVEDLPDSGVLETEDGVLVEGQNYFNQFDDKEIEVE